MEFQRRLIAEKLKGRGLPVPVAPPNPYQQNFLRFLQDCCWTIDKAMAGKVRPWPFEGRWADYWADWDATLLGCQAPILVDKTRRTMASNVLCAFEIWLVAGGQDARWPVLQESTANRLVIIQAQKMGKNKADEGCAAEFVARSEAMYHLLLEHGIKQRWPGFPEFTWGFGWGTASNGGKIVAVGEGPDQLRGPGATWLRMEELSGWEQAQATCSVALPTLYPYGRACAVTTASAGTYAQEIRDGNVSTGLGLTPDPPLTRVLPLTKRGDWHVLEIRGARDIPGYEPGKVGAGMSPMDFRREILGDWSATSGKQVFPEFGDMHEAVQKLPFDPQRELLCGWDLPAGTGGTPAFVATQITHQGQWLLYGSLLPKADETVPPWDFAERVAYYLTETFARPLGLELSDLKLVHYGDPAGTQAPIAGGARSTRGEIKSAMEAIRDGGCLDDAYGDAKDRPGFGWDIMPGEVSLTKRLDSIRTRLCVNVCGAPALLVSPTATFIREGFRGGYAYKQRTDGRYELDPAKNRYSHVFDALSYPASRVFLHRGNEDPLAAYLAQQRQNTPAYRVAGSRGR